MKKYFQYLNYILKHKWFVFLECVKLGIIWRGIIHDWSKFLPSEFIPYARHFYSNKKQKRDETGYYKPYDTGDSEFDFAWFLHQKRNRHHWQFWVMVRDNDDDKGDIKVLDMPLIYRKEMLADWRGASRAQGFGGRVKKWYDKNGSKMKLHSNTRLWIERQLNV